MSVRPSADDYRREVAGWPSEAREAGYAAGKRRDILHAWDCPSVYGAVHQAELLTAASDFETRYAAGEGPKLPEILTREEAQAFLQRARAKRTCLNCREKLGDLWVDRSPGSGWSGRR